MGDFAGKVILITGATSGIGRALALQMAGKGVRLILAARRMQELKLVEEACRTKGAECQSVFIDMADSGSVVSFAENVKTGYPIIDILINNAGISQRSHAEETTIDVDRKIMEINFFGQVTLTKALWPLLIQSKHANIVLVSSVVGTFGFAQRSAYAASKHALEGFFESWLIENNRPNIHFTTVSPGRIFTNLSYTALKADGSAHQQLDSGQANGISAEVCANKIIKAISNDTRKIYVVKSEIVLVFLRKCFPYLFFRLAKNLKTA